MPVQFDSGQPCHRIGAAEDLPSGSAAVAELVVRWHLIEESPLSNCCDLEA